MGNNTCSGQIQGPFKANQELFNLIQHNAERSIMYIKHIGIQAPQGTVLSLNTNTIEIGLTGIYENDNIALRSIFFYTDVAEDVIIDYIIV